MIKSIRILSLIPEKKNLVLKKRETKPIVTITINNTKSMKHFKERNSSLKINPQNI